MKTNLKILTVLICLSIGIAGHVAAQERPMYLTVTTIHWNPDYENFSMDEWKAIEKEYFEKVTMKNVIDKNKYMTGFHGDYIYRHVP